MCSGNLWLNFWFTLSPYLNIKWVTFDGTNCTSAGIHGIKCKIFGSYDVDEVIKEDTDTYALLCISNVYGTNRAVCGLSGDNNSSASAFVKILTKIMNLNSREDSHYIAVLAFS